MLNCRLPRPAGLVGNYTMLGRPWRSMATVVYKNCWLDGHIASEGWSSKMTESWENLTFAEYNSTGPGARATRPSPATILGDKAAQKWTAAAVLKGWDPLTP